MKTSRVRTGPRCSLLLMIVFFSLRVDAQQGYYLENFDFSSRYFSDSVNARLIKPLTDGLGTLLVRAYVEGKIEGYKYSYRETELKWEKVPKDLWPAEWSPKEFYFLNDEVTYKGERYVMHNEIRPSPVTPDKSPYWYKWPLRGMAVSTKYDFPSMKDTLPKASFLKSMIWYWMEIPYAWVSSYDYEIGDEVLYQRKVYEAGRKTEPGIEPTDRRYWYEPYSPFHLFHSLQYLNAYEVLGYYKVEGDTIRIPQWIGVRLYDEDAGYVGRSVVHVKYCDAMAYLNSIPQPALYETRLGYLGKKQFLLEDFASMEMVKFIKENIRQHDMMVFDQLELDTFMVKPVEKYSAVQELGSTDVLITKSGHAIAMIPGETIIDLAQLKDPVMFTYSEGFENLRLHSSWRDNSRIDSLSPLPSCNESKRKSLPYRWTEEHLLGRTDDRDDLSKEVWNIVVDAYRAKKITKVKGRSFNSMDYDWSKVYKDTINLVDLGGIGWTNLLNHNNEPSSMDSYEPGTLQFHGLSIVYERGLDGNRFVPVGVKVYSGEYAEDVFSWEDVKSLLNGSFFRFMEAVENGTISSGRIRLVEGLAQRE